MNILFLCVANSARSIMAEGLARHHWGKKHQFFSAGSVPFKPHPLALQALMQQGISTEGLVSNSIDEVELDKMDYVITLCKEEYCPIVPGNMLHWPFPDPVDLSEREVSERFVVTSKNIYKKLSQFMQDLQE